MPRPTAAYVELDALRHNYRSICNYVNTFSVKSENAIRDALPNAHGHSHAQTRIMAMVKADAYGHGLLQVAKTLQEEQVAFMGVATPEEGLALRENGIKTPILCVGASFDDISSAAKANISLTVYSAESARDLLAQLPSGQPVKVHIKLETGMNRLGIKSIEELLSTLELLRDPRVVPEGIFTHFATSDCLDKTFTHRQANRFLELCAVAKPYVGSSCLRHTACTGAMLDCPEYHFEMVRPGIALYGYYPSGEVTRPLDLKPVLRWETRIAQVREAGAGDTIGYGRAGSFAKPGRVAVLPVGYGDGYRRVLENKAYVLIEGKKAPLLGRPCMDQIMADVTDIPSATAGSLALLLGEWGSEHFWADDMAALAHTIPYEITLGITGRVPKIYCGQ